jgi:hypothetical protein
MYTLELIVEKSQSSKTFLKKTKCILISRVADNAIIVLKRAIKARHQHGYSGVGGF